MTDTPDIHQIEYRWHHTRDLSPVASSMSQESTRGWDSRIRAWVRHPNVDQPAESVRYQIFPNEFAALAWRYRNLQAAELDDGTRGRPLVSRVLVGHADVLTPDAAIVLCRTGLPHAAGERAGRVMPDTELPPIRAGELAAPIVDSVAWLDREAAFELGLSQVVAAALSDPNTPLAINIESPLIFRPPNEGSQALLLWGLRRLTQSFLGTVRRGWSFSTFELPLGEVDPRTLPDIVFRLAQPAQAAPPTTPRKEIKVRPGDSGTSANGSPAATLAAWLTAEYQEVGGSGLERLIAQSAIGQSPQDRLDVAYEILRVKWSPVMMSDAPAQSMYVTLTPVPPTEEESLEPPSVAATEVSRAEIPPAEVHLADKQDPRLQHIPELRHDMAAACLSDELELLVRARDLGELQSILFRVLKPDTPSDGPDRRKARMLMRSNNFYTSIFAKYNCKLSAEDLAYIFTKVVIPDLDRKTVRDEVTDWARRADPSVIDALIVAARLCSADVWDEMRGILQPVLASRWLEDHNLTIGLELTPAPATSPPTRESGRGLMNRFRRG